MVCASFIFIPAESTEGGSDAGLQGSWPPNGPGLPDVVEFESQPANGVAGFVPFMLIVGCGR
jgi:hypothetical protein